MFDQLHDPEPPPVTSGHLAAVAERAAGMRRRRVAAASSVAVVGLVAAGAVAVAVTATPDEPGVEFAGEPLPEASAPIADGQPTDDAAAPTTTVLDPASLPPAVPVNPDPSDLPPATPADPGTSDDGGSDDGSGDSDGDGSTGGSAEQSSGTDADDTGTSGDDGADDDAGTAELDIATSAALRAADPVVAVTASGAAVWFPDLDGEPLVLGSGGDGVVRADFLDDGTATVERRGRTVLSTYGADGSAGEPIDVGTAHEVGPDGSTVCGLAAGTPAVVCVEDGETTTIPLDRSDVTPTDLTWLDGDTVLAIGTLGEAWTISIVELATGDATTRGFAGQSFFDDLRFAGRDANGRLAVHDAGTDTLLLGTLDRFGGWDPDQDGDVGSALEVRRFDGPMRSVWLDGATELLVAADGTLSVGGDELPGTFVSART